MFSSAHAGSVSVKKRNIVIINCFYTAGLVLALGLNALVHDHKLLNCSNNVVNHQCKHCKFCFCKRLVDKK